MIHVKHKVISKLMVSGLIAVLAVGLAACSSTTSTTRKQSTTSSKSYTIGLLNGDNADPYFYSVWAGALAEAKQYPNVKIFEQGPPTFDYTSQVPLFEDMIAKHVSAILLSSDATGTTFNAELAQAKKAGIPVVIVNESESDMDNTPYALSFITASNTALGAAAGKEACTLTHGKGTFGVINTSVTVISLEHRYTGFKNYVTAHCPGVKLLPQEIAGDSVSTSDSFATDLIEAHPNLKLIYATDDFNAEGAATALKDTNKVGTIKEVAIDAEPVEITELKAGVIQALIAQQPFEVGKTGVRYLMDALTGHKSLIVRNVEPYGILLTPANINEPQYKDVPYDPTVP